MALSADGQFTRVIGANKTRSLPVKQATAIYKTALVGLDRATGYARGLVAGDQFQGVAFDLADNSAGANAAKNVVVYIEGEFPFTLSGAAVTHIGRPVFASADGTLTLLGGGNSYVGRITAVPESNTVMVEIDPMHRLTQTVSVPLTASASAAVKNAIAAFGFAIVVVAIKVWFETKPDGTPALDVGTDDSDPDELVDAYGLTNLTNGDVATMTLAGTAVAANTRIWANVGQASSTGGAGGGLAMEYFPLP